MLGKSPPAFPSGWWVVGGVMCGFSPPTQGYFSLYVPSGVLFFN